MQATDTPQKRPDLALTPNTEDGRTVTVVHDPVSGRYFRIREVEGFIVDQLDGGTSLEAVHAALLREFPGVRLSLETLLKFVDRLASMGWLVGTTNGVAPPRAQLPFYYRLLRAKLPPIPVDPLFQRMQPLVRMLYTPLAVMKCTHTPETARPSASFTTTAAVSGLPTSAWSAAALAAAICAGGPAGAVESPPHAAASRTRARVVVRTARLDVRMVRGI